MTCDKFDYYLLKIFLIEYNSFPILCTTNLFSFTSIFLILSWWRTKKLAFFLCLFNYDASAFFSSTNWDFKVSPLTCRWEENFWQFYIRLSFSSIQLRMLVPSHSPHFSFRLCRTIPINVYLRVTSWAKPTSWERPRSLWVTWCSA